MPECGVHIHGGVPQTLPGCLAVGASFYFHLEAGRERKQPPFVPGSPTLRR